MTSQPMRTEAGRSEDAGRWMPRERWDALVRGEGCPLCEEVASPTGATRHGYFVADLTASRLRLAAEQHLPGYCVLICRQHVREPYELDRATRAAFFEDMTRVGEALERVLGAVKTNFSILGNAVPHLHCHVQPRFYGDPYPGRPVEPPSRDRRVFLAPEEYAQRAAAIRAALGV